MSNSKRSVQVASAAALSLAMAVPAFAEPVLDFTGVGTAVTGELTPALTAAMPIAGVILAIGIAWKLYKRFCK